MILARIIFPNFIDECCMESLILIEKQNKEEYTVIEI